MMQEAGKGYALFIGRCVLGVTALLYGISKTFGLGEQGSASEGSISTATGLPSGPVYNAVCIALIVLGVALLLGTFARLAAWLLLAGIVLHAIGSHKYESFFMSANGCEYLLALAALCVVIATHGAGALQVKIGSDKK